MSSFDRFPSIDDLRPKARRRIPHFAWEYLDSGTGADRVMQGNRTALDRVQFQQRILQGKLTPELGVEIFGQRFDVPFGICPIGATGMMWPGVEFALARLAAEKALPYTLSTVATRTPEEIGPLTKGNGWFQLYALGDFAAQDDLLRRAKAAGFKVLVLTVDVPLSSRRERQRRAGLTVPPKMSPWFMAQMALRPAWLAAIARHGKPAFRTLAPYIPQENLTDVTRRVAQDLHPQPDWSILDRLRAVWDGPIVFKGILTVADAVQARDAGVDGVWVSNHGGRQLDGAVPSIEALPKIREAVGAEYPLIFDSGVRSGLDIARGIALGADLVMLGRGFVYGAAALGDTGPAHVHHILRDDLINVMGQIGVNRLDALKEAIIR